MTSRLAARLTLSVLRHIALRQNVAARAGSRQHGVRHVGQAPQFYCLWPWRRAARRRLATMAANLSVKYIMIKALYLQFFFGGLVSLLVITNPLSKIPLFVSLTQGMSDLRRAHQARMACVYAAAIMLVSLLAGNGGLGAFGISYCAPRIAGGLVVATLGYRMLFLSQGPGMAPNTKRRAEHLAEEGELVAVNLGTAEHAGEACHLAGNEPVYREAVLAREVDDKVRREVPAPLEVRERLRADIKVGGQRRVVLKAGREYHAVGYVEGYGHHSASLSRARWLCSGRAVGIRPFRAGEQGQRYPERGCGYLDRSLFSGGRVTRPACGITGESILENPA